MMIKQKISLTILMGIAVTLTIGTVSSSISYIFAADEEDDNNDNKEQIQEELEEQDEKSHKLEAKEWNQKNKLVEPEQKMIIPVANAQQKPTIVGSPAPDQQQLVKQLEAEKQKLIQELEQRKQQQQIQEQILNQNEMKLILGEVTIPIDANTHLNLDLPKSKIVVEPSAAEAATQTTSTSAGVAK